MRNLRCLVRTVALGTVLVMGCGGVTSPGSGAPVAERDLPSAAAHAECEGLVHCCSMASIAFDVNACKDRVAAAVQVRLDSSRNGKYDPAAGGRCVAWLEQVAANCGAAPPRSDGPLDDRTCSYDLFTGTSPPGGPCQSGADCIPPASCEAPANPGQGQASVCVSRPHAKAGEACAGDCTVKYGSVPDECSTSGDSGAFCYLEDRLYCAPDGTCHSNDAGEACGGSVSCGPAEYCDSNQVCRSTLGAGAACENTDQCANGFYCDSVTRKCMARQVPLAPCAKDEECGEPFMCVSGRCGFDADLCTGQTSSAS